VREAIRGVILRAYTEGIAPRDAVPLIREALGEPALFPRWQQAVYNYLADLTEQGVEQERAEEMARAYRTRLIDARAFMIARTETVAAQTAGRTEVYQQALDEGWLDADTKKRWMAAPEGPCPICEALDGTEVGWDETWAGGVAAPPAHVNCRCTYVLVEAT
jgi:SPP1 gp7 family putative phage head morphogenesis protein